MAQPVAMYFGFAVIRAIFGAAVAVVFIWLMLKLGRLADAYRDKIKPKA